MLCVLTHVNIMQIIYSKRDKYLRVHKQRDFYVQEKKKAMMVLKKATSELMKFSNMRGSRSK